MQQAPSQEQVVYASLGMRFAAVLIDAVVLSGLFILVIMVYVFVLVGQGRLDPNDPAAAQELSRQIAASDLSLNLVFFAALFVYYALLEAIFGASAGKLVLGMRVTMRDGSRATGVAVILRNLVRIPEAALLYIPAAISCLASPTKQRLGDHLGRTVVVRRLTARAPGFDRPAPSTGWPAGGAPPTASSRRSVAPAPAAPHPTPMPPYAPPGPYAQPEATEVGAAVTRLKTAALAARGAHLTYLRFSERELAAGRDEQSGGYSDGYVSAWFTLTDAVAKLAAARSELYQAAARVGETPEHAVGAHPDLSHLLDELAPYFAASDDVAIHGAFLAVARAEASSSA